MRLVIVDAKGVLQLLQNLKNLDIGTFAAAVVNHLKMAFIIIIIMTVKTMTI